MTAVVNLTCRGTARRAHTLRTVAQFRYDDGWVRVHNQGERDAVLQEPNGDLKSRHRAECTDPRCTRVDVFTTESLYRLLDWARENGKDEVPLG
ncbi:hypothetical protein [uncultured Microbacterium sp.]|uniref:hypothetical protein n=1 Tax=uncultured Microbacterium sp. TaxID=191216 RepID=UPI0028EA781A|nr:hypothetical protein [uncultured Microbacterium sp.]